MGNKMENLLLWLDTNKQWFFEGLGVALIVGLGSILYSRSQARGAKQNQRSGDGSTNIQAGGNVHIDSTRVKQNGSE